MALNPDSIPTSEQVRETLLDRFYYPWKKQIWGGLTVLTVAVVGYLAARQVRERREAEQWDRYQAALEVGRTTNPMPGTPEERQGADERVQVLRRIAADFPADSVTPWALSEIAKAQVEAGRFDEALETLRDLGARFPKFALNSESADAGPDGNPRALRERMESRIRNERDWVAKTAYVHPQPSTQTLALVETTVGSFWLGFYEEQSPAHVAGFIDHAKRGSYNGTQVYDTRTAGTPESPSPMLFEAGAAASRPETWTDGPAGVRNPREHDRDEPGATIEGEDSRFSIRHVRGIVSAVVMPSGESNQRFLVVCAPSGLVQYDGQNTPFGMVIDREGSFGVIDRLSLATTYNTHSATKNDPERFTMRDHPYPPIWIRRVSIWKNEKLDAGHTWDTSRTASQTPEPWEATLPTPPLPVEFAPKADPVEPPPENGKR